MDVPFLIPPLYREADLHLNHFEGLIENYKSGTLKIVDLADLPTKLESLSAAIDALSVQVYSQNLETAEFKAIIAKADENSKESIKIFCQVRNQNLNLTLVLMNSLQTSTCSLAMQNREMLRNLMQQEPSPAPLPKEVKDQKFYLSPVINQVVSDVCNLQNQVEAGMNEIHQTPLSGYYYSEIPFVELFKVAILNGQLRNDMFAQSSTFSKVGIDILRADLSAYNFDISAVRSYSQSVFSHISDLFKNIPNENLLGFINKFGSDYDNVYLNSYKEVGILPQYRQIPVEGPKRISRILPEGKRISAVSLLNSISEDKKFTLKMVEKLDNEITFEKGLDEIVSYLEETTTKYRSSYNYAEFEKSKVCLGMEYSTQGNSFDYFFGIMITAQTKIDMCRWAGIFFCRNILLTDAKAYMS